MLLIAVAHQLQHIFHGKEGKLFKAKLQLVKHPNCGIYRFFRISQP
jgi:hypothetical protein